MLRIYYGVLKPAFGDKVRLFYSDTDSLGLILDVQDPYPILSKLVLDDKPLFDFSSLRNSHDYYDNSYAGQPGLLKDEVGDGVISRYVGISKKMYCLDIHRDSGNEFKKKCKGVKTSALKSCTFDTYKNCLFYSHSKHVASKSFRSFGQQMYTIETSKLAFCPINLSRYYTDVFTSVPHGYRGIKKPEEFVVEYPIIN